MTRLVFTSTWTDGIRCGHDVFNEVVPGGPKEMETRKAEIVAWHKEATKKIFGPLISPFPALPEFIIVVEDYLDFQI